MKKEQQHTKKTIFFIVTSILMTIYLLWRVFFTLPFQEGILQVIFGILLIVAETITVFTTFELYYRKIKSDNYQLDLPDIQDEDYPDIDVFIATHNESCDLLYKTANACTYMDYPDTNKVHIYFCDDGNRNEVHELAKSLNIGYLGLADNKEAKSGNLNNALEHTHSPLVATFDADMIPQHTFLMKTVPYFLLPKYIKEDDVWRKRTNEELEDTKSMKIGLIQTPQSFYNPDLFQFNLFAENTIPNEQDFFSKEVNIMRNSSNAIAYTGSNTIISRQALMDIGGFPLKTITEDFETSVRIQKEGYITYATNEVQAAGLSTTTISSMFKQRTRWARGVIQSIQNTKAIFTPKLPLAARLTYLSAYLYWWSFFNRIIFILAPIMFALFDFQVVNTDFKSLLIFWLPAYFFYSISMRYLSSNIRNQRWSQVIDTILAPYLIFPVLLETLHIHQRTFKVTNKKKETSRNKNLYYAIPHILLLILSVLAIIRYVKGKYGWALIYSSIILFWLFYNLVAILYALFFMLGRPSPRKSERIKASVSAKVSYNNYAFNATTYDLSDQGISLLTDTEYYIPDDQNVKIQLKDRNYSATLTGSIVNVRKQNNQWLYALKVKPESTKDKSQYSQIIYDRNHSLPVEMDLWSTAYDDFIRNIQYRIKKAQIERRKSIRMNIHKKICFENGTTGYIEDFNFKYISVSHLKLYDEDLEYYKWITDSNINLLLKPERQLSDRILFKITNLDTIIQNNLIDQLLVDLKQRS